MTDTPDAPPDGHAGGTYALKDESRAAQRSRLRTDSLIDAGHQQTDSSSLDAPTDPAGDRAAEQDTPDAPPAVSGA